MPPGTGGDKTIGVHLKAVLVQRSSQNVWGQARFKRAGSGAIDPLGTQSMRLQRRRELLGLGHFLRLQGSIEVLYLVVQRIEPTRLLNGRQEPPVQLQTLRSQGPEYPLRIDNPSHDARLHVPRRRPGGTSATAWRSMTVTGMPSKARR